MDPRAANGGMFLGLNGVVVKSHGSTDGFGFAAAVDLAVDMARNDMIKRIAEDTKGIAAKFAPASPDPEVIASEPA